MPPDRPAEGPGSCSSLPRACCLPGLRPSRASHGAEPAGTMRAGGQATFPPRPYPGGNQSSLLFSMSLRSLPFVPCYLSLPGIRATPRWLGEGLAVAKIFHLKTTIESFRPALVVPELYFRDGEKGIVLFLFSQQNSRASCRRADWNPGPSSFLPLGAQKGQPAGDRRTRCMTTAARGPAASGGPVRGCPAVADFGVTECSG